MLLILWLTGVKKNFTLLLTIISPLNGQFIFKDDKFLLGKSEENNDDFDNLLFVYRDIKKVSITSNIKIISPYGFFTNNWKKSIFI